jgi:hypothetical protein
VNRSSAPILGKKGSVNVHAPQARKMEDHGPQKLAEGGHHKNIGIHRAQDLYGFGAVDGFGLKEGEVELLGGDFHGRRGEL